MPPLVSVLAYLCTAIGERFDLPLRRPAVKELLVARLDSPLEDIRVKVGKFQTSMPPLVSILACLTAAVTPLVSVLACLSAAAPAVKELLVIRLDSPLKDIRVKKDNISAPSRHC
jgi:hypothetical protein